MHGVWDLAITTSNTLSYYSQWPSRHRLLQMQGPLMGFRYINRVKEIQNIMKLLSHTSNVSRNQLIIRFHKINACHQSIEFRSVIINRTCPLLEILKLFIHCSHIIVGARMQLLCFKNFSQLLILVFPFCTLLCFNCCHHAPALPLNLVATKGTLLSSGTSLKSKISSTMATKSRNSLGCKQHWNSGRSSLNLASYLLALFGTKG